MSIKRDRCVNWDADEKILLRAIIRPYLKIIVNKNLSTKTNKEKQKAWGEIMDKFNQANVRARDKKQLLNQWKLMKMESKKPVSHNRKQLLSTVGDPKPPTPSPDHWDTVMVPQEFYVDNNKYDDDSEPATATYTNSDDCKHRVARLLGVAGIDLPLRLLKQRLPYHKLGPGGSIFIIDHRGHIVMHDDLRPVIHGIVLKPNYRAVDILDVELPDDGRAAFNYSDELIKFREQILLQENGTTRLNTLQPFDNRWRVFSERRVYSWRRVRDTGYTIVVSLPQESLTKAAPSSGHLVNPRTAIGVLLDGSFSLHPDWIYCRHVEQYFATPEAELKFFLKLMNESKTFPVEKLPRIIAPILESIIDRPYMCNNDLLGRLARDAISIGWFMREDAHGKNLPLGTSTAFIATESGLTRWYHVKTDNRTAVRDFGKFLGRGPNEPWYRRMWKETSENLILSSGGRGWAIAGRLYNGSAVAGFQFPSEMLTTLLVNITEPKILNGPEDCSSPDWRCLIIDEGGWVLAGVGADAGIIIGSQTGVHLSSLHPLAMKLMIDANIFVNKTIIDYQSVCFRPQPIPPSLANLKAKKVVRFPKMKTLDRLIADFQELYDPRVLVNRSTLEGCTRAGRLWTLNRDKKSQAQKRRPLQIEDCSWPIVLTDLPGVDAMFLAFYAGCPENIPKETFDRAEIPPPQGSKPACAPQLPMRGAPAPCFPHRFEKENEFRKYCGKPLIPDP